MDHGHGTGRGKLGVTCRVLGQGSSSGDAARTAQCTSMQCFERELRTDENDTFYVVCIFYHIKNQGSDFMAIKKWHNFLDVRTINKSF